MYLFCISDRPTGLRMRGYLGNGPMTSPTGWNSYFVISLSSRKLRLGEINWLICVYITCKWQSQKRSPGSVTSNPVQRALLRACRELDFNLLHAFSFQMSEYQPDTAGKKKDSQALSDNSTCGVSTRQIRGGGNAHLNHAEISGMMRTVRGLWWNNCFPLECSSSSSLLVPRLQMSVPWRWHHSQYNGIEGGGGSHSHGVSETRMIHELLKYRSGKFTVL